MEQSESGWLNHERARTLPYQSLIWFAERPMRLLYPSNPQPQSLEPRAHWKKRKQHRLQQIFPTRYGASSLKSWSGNNTYAGLQRTNECSWDTIQIWGISCVRVIRIDSPGDSRHTDLCPLFAKLAASGGCVDLQRDKSSKESPRPKKLLLDQGGDSNFSRCGWSNPVSYFY